MSDEKKNENVCYYMTIPRDVVDVDPAVVPIPKIDQVEKPSPRPGEDPIKDPTVLTHRAYFKSFVLPGLVQALIKDQSLNESVEWLIRKFIEEDGKPTGHAGERIAIPHKERELVREATQNIAAGNPSLWLVIRSLQNGILGAGKLKPADWVVDQKPAEVAEPSPAVWSGESETES